MCLTFDPGRQPRSIQIDDVAILMTQCLPLKSRRMILKSPQMLRVVPDVSHRVVHLALETEVPRGSGRPRKHFSLEASEALRRACGLAVGNRTSEACVLHVFEALGDPVVCILGGRENPGESNL